MTELAEKNNQPWEIELTQNPDKKLAQSDAVIVTSDSVILDRCKIWTNLAAEIIKQKINSANPIDLCFC